MLAEVRVCVRALVSVYRIDTSLFQKACEHVMSAVRDRRYCDAGMD